LAVAVGGVLAGVMRQTRPTSAAEDVPTRRPQAPPDGRAAQAPPAPPAKEPKERWDHFNAPLPREAVARLGTVAFRHGHVGLTGTLTYSPDGKHLVSGGGGWIRRWDLATGQELVNLGDGGRPMNYACPTLFTADGKLARICFGWGRCTE